MRTLRLPAALLLLASVVFPAASRAADVDLASQVKEIDLANGMKFLFVRRPGSGVFSAYVRVKVGGADEQVGATGVAHLFEHMAFKGTSVIGTKDWNAERPLLEQTYQLGEALNAERAKRGSADPKVISDLSAKLAATMKEERKLIKKDEFTDILMRNGAADLNATTDKDMTSYFMSLPKNRLNLWALMEAQRFAGPVLREFYSERDVVMEERRMRTDESPMGLLYEAANATAFDNSPYRWPTIGWMPDLQTLSISDSMKIRRRAYVPQNAVGAIVGDLDEAEVKQALEQTFGTIPRGPEPVEIKAVEPPQQGEKRRVVRFAASPQILMAFHKPTLPDEDDYVFDVIDQLLSGGRTSRLYKRLVLEKKVASEVFTFGGPGSRLPNLFYVGAEPLPGKSTADVEREILAALDELKAKAPGADELARARRQIETDELRSWATNEGLASGLSLFEVLAGDWHYLVNHGAHIEKISGEEVRAVAQKYLVPDNRTVVTLESLPGAPAPEGT